MHHADRRTNHQHPPATTSACHEEIFEIVANLSFLHNLRKTIAVGKQSSRTNAYQQDLDRLPIRAQAPMKYRMGQRTSDQYAHATTNGCRVEEELEIVATLPFLHYICKTIELQISRTNAYHEDLERLSIQVPESSW